MSLYNSDELLRKALADAKHLALESMSDEGIPLELHELSLFVQEKAGQRITAIKRDEGKLAVPEFEPDDKLAWCIRRLTGQLRSEDPKVVLQPYRGWGFVIAGNGVIVAVLLNCLGLKRAKSASPTFCYVCDECEIRKFRRVLRKR